MANFSNGTIKFLRSTAFLFLIFALFFTQANYSILFAQTTEIILDDIDSGTSRTGNWNNATAASQHYGSMSQYATVGNAIDTFRFTPDLPTTAEYDVAVWNSCYHNRSTDVPHTIVHALGEDIIAVDQDCDTGSSGEWFDLGRFSFTAGNSGYVEISDEGLSYGFTTYIGADAVRFTLAPNQAPLAVIATPTIHNLNVALDGSNSSDSDGDVLTFHWDFGDGNSSSEQIPSHTFAQAGIYTVTLTVSDSQLASHSVQISVTVTNPIEIIIDNIDSETSTVGTWRNATGATNHFGNMSVYATVGGGVDAFRFTPAIPITDSYDVYAWNSCYSNRATNVPHKIVHALGETTIAVDQDCDTGSSGEWFFLGTFTFNTGTSGYVEISDEGLSYGTTTYIGADAIRLTTAGSPVPNTAPIAVIATPVINNFDVIFDGSGSSDPEGDGLTFSWNFGDGNASVQPSPTHTYTQEGAYTVSLTVSDGSLTHQIQTALSISTSPPPPPTVPPASGQAIEGFASVTQALDATGTGTRYDVGGGNNFASELDGVSWQSLQPGDVVNIYYRETPYRHKILLSEQGTAANPIVINGVTNANGDRPTISAQDAVSINPQEWDSDYRTTLILINKRHSTGSYGVNAEHYLIQNLRLADVRPTNSFTHNGVTEHYLGFSRAMWSAGGQYITLQGMVIENNGSGVFIQANDDPGSLSKTWTIRGSKFENNGHGNRDHQVYFQAISEPGEYNMVEGCYFGAPTPGQESIAQLKMRSTGVVVRYNYFNSAHRTLDIVEAQDAIPDWMYSHYSQQEILDYYRTSYVYGNIFVNDHQASSGQPSTRPLHFGADSFDEPFFTTHGAANGQPGMRGYEAPTYFFHNTFYMRADTADMWRGSLFDTENNNSNGPTPTPGEVRALNNIIEFAGSTRIGVMNRSGTTNFEGANLIDSSSLTIFAESDQYASNENFGDDPDVHISYNGSVLQQSASFVDATNPSLAAKNFMLSTNSPARGQAVPLPAALAAFSVALQPAGVYGGAVLRSSAEDLGALGSPMAGPPPTNQVPIAVIGTPVINGLEVTFDGSDSSDPDNDALTFSWDFGDGHTNVAQSPTHTYSQEGHYTLNLTVNDGALADSVQISVTVTDDQSVPSSEDQFSTASCGALEPLNSSFVTNNASALPTVGMNCDRYYAELNDNTNNVTLHFHQSQGRLDAQLISFPFEFIARNIGIGTISDTQTAPSSSGNPYIFAGVQVHVTDLNNRNSSHVVIGHRGSTGFTIEGKHTVNGSSSVNDDGANALPLGRGDIRIVGNANRTLTVYWQQPNLNPAAQADAWQLYRGTGILPGSAPLYGNDVYVGLITYAYGQTGIPFVGTADSIEWDTDGSGSPPSSGGAEIIVDNNDPGTSSSGSWADATGANNHFGSMSLYATVGDSIDRYRFTPNIPTTGEYDVHAWNSCYNNRAIDVPHKIMHATGETTVAVDQDCDTGSSGEWLALGRYTFNAGSDGYLEISDEGLSSGSTTYIGADAIRFTLIE